MVAVHGVTLGGKVIKKPIVVIKDEDVNLDNAEEKFRQLCADNPLKYAEYSTYEYCDWKQDELSKLIPV